MTNDASDRFFDSRRSRRSRPRSPRHPRSFLLIPLILGCLGTSLWAAPTPDPTPLWYGADGRALPFDSDDEIVEFLANAPIVASKPIGRGIAGTLKLTLERDGVRLHAAFRTISLERGSPQASGSQPDRHLFRDYFGFEVAAYRLSRLLGLDRVPPTTLRRVDGKDGSVQLWIENATTEADLIERGEGQLTAARHLQRQTMLVFDNLIYNFDRHRNNMLYDKNGRLWFIDHTRTFKRLGELTDRDIIAVCDRTLYEHLVTLDRKTLERELSPYLGSLELIALEERRKLLLRHFEKLIAERGRERVLLN